MMNIEVRWDRQRAETLVCEFHGNWSWHECREAMQTMAYLQESTPFSADYVFDFSNSTLTPRTCLNQLKDLLNMRMDPPPRQIVVVDQFHRSRMMETMLISVSHALGIQFVDSLKQARRVLEEEIM